MLVMECFVQNSPSQALRLEHTRHKGLELDIAMVHFRGDRPG